MAALFSTHYRVSVSAPAATPGARVDSLGAAAWAEALPRVRRTAVRAETPTATDFV
jgi:hypothetical protein